jgi:hypothetical protein
MNIAQGAEKKASFSDKFVQFLQRNRIFIFIFTLLIALGLVVFFVWSSVHEQIEKASTQKAEELQVKYAQWYNERDTEKRTRYKAELDAFIEKVIKEYPNTMAGQRALITRFYLNREQALFVKQFTESGDKEKTKEDKSPYWLNMVNDLLMAVKSNPESYLAEISLYNAAVVLEEIEYYQKQESDSLKSVTLSKLTELIPKEYLAGYQYDLEQIHDLALALYTYFSLQYKDAVDYPHVLFSITRLLEAKADELKGKGENEKVKEIISRIKDIYLELETDFKSNDWTKIAKNRSIMLKIKEGGEGEQEE